MRVIALAGLTGSGKTTIAQLIEKWCKAHRHKYRLLSFSNVLVGTDLSCKARHDIAHQDIGEILVDVYNRERDLYAALVKTNKENNFVETVIVIDDVKYLDDLKFLMNFKSINVFIDASTRLGNSNTNASKDNLARGITSGKYPLDMFHIVINNNQSKKTLTKLMDPITPNLIYR